MPTSRAVVVLGMHRSGTSAVARGLAALGVYLGDDFLDAQPENPTGYWEDRHVVALDDRVLKGFGLRWDSVERIARAEFARGRFRKLRREAGRYCERTFTAHAVWGFKDPRVVRVLPFWQRVLRDCDAQDCYVIAIRNPRSVAASLFARQAMPADDAYRLWLANVVPFLGDAFDRPFVVVDYDVLMRDARVQLERIAQALGLPADSGEVERFAAEFLDAGLRHASFEPQNAMGVARLR
jgi:hypothetical protein